jgi:hypothetical protein
MAHRVRRMVCDQMVGHPLQALARRLPIPQHARTPGLWYSRAHVKLKRSASWYVTK